MDEKDLNTGVAEAVVGDDGDNSPYIETIKKLKDNTVSREAYDKLKAENKKLLDSVINGTQIDGQEVVDKISPQEELRSLRKDILLGDTQNMNNLEYTQKILRIRELVMKEGGADPFEAGNEGASSPRDLVDGEKVAEFLEQLVEDAEDSPTRFNADLKRYTVKPSK